MTTTHPHPFVAGPAGPVPDSLAGPDFRALVTETLATKAVRTFDIGVDLDGVVYDFVHALRTYIMTVTGRTAASMPDPTRWEFYLDWDLTLEEFLELFNAGVNAGHIFRVGRPLSGVVEGLKILLGDGHRIHIVTDRGRVGRPGLSEQHTRFFLDRNDVAFTSLTVDHDKTKVRTDVFIDDRPENYLALREAGVDAYLRSHRYNDHVPTPTGRRVHSFLEFTHGVLTAARAA